MANPKIRVAVLGGGLGSMSCAYWLTSTPELRDRYEVTVYQQGWRLGGKGASGRNQALGDRIEEHGLHMFMGFYENAFRTVRAVYDDWAIAPANPFQSWADAFTRQYRVTFQEDIDGEWRTWNLLLPPRPGTPGDGDAVPDVAHFLEELVTWLFQLLQQAAGSQLTAFSWVTTSWPQWLRDLLGKVDELVQLPGELVRDTVPPALEPFLRLLRDVIRPTDVETGDALGAVELLVGDMIEWVDAFFDDFDDLSDTLRRLWTMMRLGLAIARGLIGDVLPWGGAEGFARIDEYEFRAWLQRWGATDPDVYWSAPIQGFYDLIFAWEQGKSSDPEFANVAAGAALKALLKMAIGYKGSPLWKLNAGMGDVIFSPLYQVCKARGVNFEFFHRVTNLGLSDTKRTIQRIELKRQADLISGPGTEYDPLFDVKGLPSWPSEPFWSQLVNGPALKAAGVNFESAWNDTHVATRTLEYGVDYDLVVLGIPVGAHKDICPELIEAHDAWREMNQEIPTTMTSGVQLWPNQTIEEMGWTAGETVETSYVHPLESWAEMSHLLKTENWPQGDPTKPAPKSVQYLTGVLQDPAVIPPYSDPTFPAQQHARVRQIAIDWLNANVGHIWPDAVVPGTDGLDYDKLVDWLNRTGEDRFDFQFWKANINPSERYVLTPAGSTKYRMDAGESGLTNLFLAGDWVRTSINGGSAEAGVEGGMRASRAICGVPEEIADDPWPQII